MNIAIFCSSRDDLAPRYFTLTSELAERLAHDGHTIIYGGSHYGLMRCLAETTRQAGGRLVGVVPRIVLQRERQCPYLDVEIPCEDLNDRKAIMIARADAIIALPGGIGTLDELFTVASARSIGYHTKRVILYNMDGFWDSLVTMLDTLAQHSTVNKEWREGICPCATLEEVVQQITSTYRSPDERRRSSC